MEENQNQTQAQTDPQGGAETTTETENQNSGKKMFTQDEVDNIVRERLSRVKSTPQTNQQPQQTPAVDTSAFDAQLANVRSQLVGAKIESLMAMSGIKSEKIERAARLVDASKCVNKDGAPDSEKIRKEIDELLKDFPELKATTEEGSTGFKFGANSGNKGEPSEIASRVSSIFGNKK